MKSRLTLSLLCLLWFAPLGVRAEEAVVVVPASTVHSKPEAKAECVTQVPLGDRVHVVKAKGPWLQVSVPDQYRLADGYPGWVLKSDTGAPPASTGAASVIVVAPRVELREHASRPGRRLAKTLGATYLGASLQTTGKTDGHWLEVQIPGGSRTAWVNQVQVTAHPLTPTGADMVRLAETLQGTHYLWGGISVDGIDCSGLTYMVYRAHGITLPRDADQQFLMGQPVEREALKAGDLVFYGKDKNNITHVAIYAGDGKMVEASSKANTVMLSSIDRRSDYQGARRVIGVSLTMPPPSP